MPKNKKENINLKKYLFPVIIGLIAFIICICALSLIALKTPYQKDNTLFQALLAVCVSSFTAAFVFVLKERKNGLIAGLIIGFVILIIMFLLFTVFSSFKLNENSLLLIPSSLLPAAIAGILAVNIKRK